MHALSARALGALSQPYPENGTDEGALFSQAIGVAIPATSELLSAIDNDLDATRFGIEWWVGHPIGDRRRILASDYLYQCVDSLEKNLVDARLHQLSLEHCDESEATFNQHMVSVRAGTRRDPQFQMEAPRRTSARDDLARTLGDMHRVGFFRAIGSTLDCLGGAIVGVLGIPTDLLRADLGQVRAWFRRRRTQPVTTLGDSIQLAFDAFVEEAIRSAGPEAWLDWTLDMRNMLVHRGRRLQLATAQVRDTGLDGVYGRPLALSSVAMHLPKSPAQSDVEVLVDTTFEPVLTEDAAATIQGVFRSTLAVVESIAAGLTRAWQLRRADPAAILQPRSQWERTPARPRSPFAGYAPGSRPVQINALLANPKVVRRMQVAALSDTDHPRWATFT